MTYSIKRRPIQAFYTLILTFLVFAAGWGCSADSNEKTTARKSVPVVVGSVIRKSVPVQLSTMGNVQPSATVSVRSLVGGKIVGVHFKEGQEVRKGDLLFSIDSRAFEQAVRQAEANIAKDTAHAKNGRVQAERYKSLIEKELVSQEQYDQARTAAESFEAILLADKAALENARILLGHCSIRSPIDGRTGNLLVHLGNTIKGACRDGTAGGSERMAGTSPDGIGTTPGSPSGARTGAWREVWRPRPYPEGRFVILPGVAIGEELERFIRERAFLRMDGAERLRSANPHRRVYALRLPGTGRAVVVKMQWLNAAAPWLRRTELAALWRFKDSALRALRGALALRAAGLSTLDPLAYWTHRPAGGREHRYLMYERIPAVESVRAVRERVMGEATRKRNLLREPAGKDTGGHPELDPFTLAMADYLRRLHGAGLRHRDVCSGNWLYTGSGADGDLRLWLIDTDGVSVAGRRSGVWKRLMDLRSLRRLDLTRRERELFLRRYLGGAYRPAWLRVLDFWWYGPRRYLMGGPS